MDEKTINLSFDDTESAEINGVYLGKEGVKRVFSGLYKGGQPKGEMALHSIQQSAIIMDVGGKTEKGRQRVVWASDVPIDGEIPAIWGWPS